ncbi:DNA-binding response regulator [Pseudonocardiaceae bacterium YIM PH 21723]|nr:DNA-binding response regulator [Pseudonocardiaceae bacterium YIM PH 21723]
MDELAIETLVEVGAILGSSAGDQERAAEILRVIRQAIPWDGVMLSSFTEAGGRSLRLGDAGFPTEVLSHLELVQVDYAPELERAIHTARLTQRTSEHRPQEGYALMQDVLLPAGFSDAIASGLQCRDGRVTGVLFYGVADIADVRPEHLWLADRLRLMLGGLADPWRTARGVLDRNPGVPAAVVLPDGDTRPALDRPPGEWLAPHGSLARQVAAEGAPPTFFWWQDPDGRFHRVVTARLTGGVLAVDTAPPLPCGLSSRETQVLRLLAWGLTNRQIASRLFVSPATVAKHVTHALAKLGAQNRAGAVTRASALGLVTYG